MRFARRKIGAASTIFHKTPAARSFGGDHDACPRFACSSFTAFTHCQRAMEVVKLGEGPEINRGGGEPPGCEVFWNFYSFRRLLGHNNWRTCHGPRNSALVNRRTDSDHYSLGAFLALGLTQPAGGSRPNGMPLEARKLPVEIGGGVRFSRRIIPEGAARFYPHRFANS